MTLHHWSNFFRLFLPATYLKALEIRLFINPWRPKPGLMRTTACIGYLVIFLSVGLKISVAQTRKIEALREGISNSNEATEKADLNFQLAEELYSFSFDEGYKHA